MQHALGNPQIFKNKTKCSDVFAQGTLLED